MKIRILFQNLFEPIVQAILSSGQWCSQRESVTIIIHQGCLQRTVSQTDEWYTGYFLWDRLIFSSIEPNCDNWLSLVSRSPECMRTSFLTDLMLTLFQPGGADYAKGQIISEWIFIWQISAIFIWQISALAPKEWSN